MGGRKHSSEYPVRHAGCRAPSAGERKMREKVHLLACAQVVFFAVSLVELLPGGFPWPCFCLVVPLGELSLGRVSAGRASRRAWFAPGRSLRKWSRRVCFCWACLFPPEVVSPGVFLPGRASFLRKWSSRVCFCRKWSRWKCLPVAGFGGWRRALVDGIGRSVDWSWPG